MKLEQLLADPSFENWAKRSNEADYQKWEAWRAEKPEHASLMDEAKLMLTGLEFERTNIPEREKQQEWKALAHRIGLEKPSASLRPTSRRRWWAAAAAAAIVMLAAGWWLFNRPAEPAWLTATTSYGELRTFELPDGSTVTLNANSKLRYPESWQAGQARRVELQGEAFFEVQQLKGKDAFVVVSENVETEVLGTRFNVFARHQKPVVSLVEGSVRLTETRTGAKALLEPGETAQFDKEENEFSITSGMTSQQSSWKNHRWMFDNTPFSEVLKRIEDEFGMDYQAENKELLKRRVSGQVSTSRLSVLLLALEALLDVEIEQENGTLEIEGT